MNELTLIQLAKLTAITIILSSTIFYMSFIAVKYSIQFSISATWYKIKDKILFSWFCWGISIPLFAFVPKNGAGYNWLFIISAICISLVGVFASTKQCKAINTLHLIFAYVGAVSSLLGLWIHYGLWWPLILQALIIGIVYFTKPKSPVTAIELCAILITCAGLSLTIY